MRTRALAALILLTAAPSWASAQKSAQDSGASRGGSVLAAVALCGADASDLLEQLRVELAGEGLSLGPAEMHELEALRARDGRPEGVLAGLAITRLDCERTDSWRLYLRLDDYVTVKTLERTLDLDSMAPVGRARAAALGALELLRASFMELAIAGPVEVTSSPERRAALLIAVRSLGDAHRLSRPELPEPEPEPRPTRTVLSAAVVVDAYPSASTALLGGALAIEVPLVAELRLGIAAEVGAARSIDRLGIVHVGAASLGASLAYAITLVPGAGAPGMRTGPVELTLGLRLSGGLGWASGESSSGAAEGQTHLRQFPISGSSGSDHLG